MSIRTKVFKIIPQFVKDRIDFLNYDIESFIKFSASEVKSGRILDAGAGNKPYEKYFNHLSYESTDINGEHSFLGTLYTIPKQNESYEAIICTQVLEHIEYPKVALTEFHRVLKPGGKLFITVPQSYGIHGEPENYYNFTRYGMQSMFKNTGFDIVFIEPIGGVFNEVGKRFKIAPHYIFNQYRGYKKILLFPFYALSIPICEFIIPIICFYLDKIDKKQDWTLGYKCYCIKR